MKLKQKLLLAVIATAFAAPAAFADTNVASHDVTVSVSQVELVSVAGTATITCDKLSDDTAPASGTAGLNLKCSVANAGTPPTYKLTSNTKNGTATGAESEYKISAKVEASSTNGYTDGTNLRLTVDMANGISGFVNTATPITAAGVDVLTGIKNVATNAACGGSCSITYSATPSGNAVPQYTDSTHNSVKVTYTLASI